MHLFTHFRAKTALLISGALLWCGSAMAETQVISSWDFVSSFTTNKEAITTDGTITINKITCSVGTGTFKGLAFQGSFIYYNSPSKCLYSANNGVRTLGILDLKSSDVITVTVPAETKLANIDLVNATAGSSSETNTYVYNVTADGNVGLRLINYAKIFTIKVEREVSGVYVAPPTIEIIGVDGVNRTVEITGEADASYIKYSFDAEATATSDNLLTYDANEKITLSNTSTIYAYAYDANGNASDVVSKEISAGAEVTLAGVTLSGNDGVIKFSSDQSTTLCKPEVTINYTYTTADGSAVQSGNVVNGGTVTLGYGTISAYAVASGYANSAVTEGVYENLDLQLSSTIDFSRAAWGGHTSDLTLTYGETAETINNVEYKPLLIDGIAVDNFLVKQVSWLKRGGYDGLYPQAGTNIAIQNVTEGQIVVVNGHTGNAAFEISLVNNGVAEADIFRTQAGSVYTFKCIKDGTLALNMDRYGYLDKIEIYDQKAPIDVTVSSVGYSTFFYNQPTKIPNDVEVYVAELSEDQSALNLTAITEVIPAKTAVILKAEEGTYTFEPADKVDPIEGNVLKGTATALATSGIDGQVYTLSHSDGENVGFYKFAGETLAANKAYLVLPSAEAAPVVRFNFGEDTEGNITGIESIEAENAGTARIFDLQGRSLRQAPQKGMYILNGRKVIR